MENKKPAYRRVLIKISGEALAGEKKAGLDFAVINEACLALSAAAISGAA